MRLTSAYTQILKLGVPLVRTIDIMAALQISSSHASHLLRRLSDDGFLFCMRRGYWALSSVNDPFMIAEQLTAPHPAYISLQSALYFHGIISQIPRICYVVSLARSQRIETPLATFSIHHVGPELFNGYAAHGQYATKIARPEKALADILYLQQNNPNIFKALPELDVSENFSFKACDKMLAAIPSEQRRKNVRQRLRALRATALA